MKERSIKNQERRAGCGEKRIKLAAPIEATLSQKDQLMALMVLINRELRSISLHMLISSLQALEEIQIDREDTPILEKGLDMLPHEENHQGEDRIKLAVEVLSLTTTTEWEQIPLSSLTFLSLKFRSNNTNLHLSNTLWGREANLDLSLLRKRPTRQPCLPWTLSKVSWTKLQPNKTQLRKSITICNRNQDNMRLNLIRTTLLLQRPGASSTWKSLQKASQRSTQRQPSSTWLSP